ncbi:MAG: MarR family transcriptional regulator [Hoeflea sp.]|uniref:MarR family winged helix-turn-helix transcriptional regulator n=1 Tax=Hoeflea sp. TaxID=1940281 RepID=UPI001DB5753A|nr:MarR family transcriptional regulator [Hoeflea sp.]MBU4530145.1 MarR family transcriptional regulator [Alphaproteobacteria bacterium]MBU4542570.1 MarR family transcriptional regulator [Alphaproteobacteria bacterium]MBU4551251.1 MarR family transcriptional regulator [Alphaproteobacteria bacterium]MBV1723074.1 MarR family transcriptional regulator [Hoeflea sp.]MBV1760085.1 MarR family transcriptional regulator [Hoeflea sp.]
MATKKPLERPCSLGRILTFATAATGAMCQEMLARHDLTLAQWVILSALWRRDGMLVSEIADYSGNNAPAASRIIDRMVEGGLVTREPALDDKRAVRVNLTPHGWSLKHLEDFHERVNALLLAGISPEETETLIRLLNQVDANARRATGPAMDPGQAGEVNNSLK